MNVYARLKLDIGWGDLMWVATGGDVSQKQIEGARQFLAAQWPERHVVAAASVRTLFDALLSEMNLPPGASVVASGVNIANMADIVAAHDLVLAPVDIDPAGLLPTPGALLQQQGATDAHVCLVTHLFGCAGPIVDATELRRRGALVVEDAAQAFAGPDFLGGAECDVTLFSFGPIKRHTALGGGVGVFADADLARRIAVRVEGYRHQTDAWFRRRAAKYLLLKTLSLPPAYAALVVVLKLLGKDPDKMIGGAARGFSGPDLMTALRVRVADRLLVLLARRIADAGREEEKRRRIAQAFLARLPASLTAVGSSAARHAFWLLPLACSDPDRVIERLRGAGFDATRGTTSLRCLDPTLPEATQLMRRIVYIPHPSELTEGSRERLLNAVLSATA